MKTNKMILHAIRFFRVLNIGYNKNRLNTSMYNFLVTIFHMIIIDINVFKMAYKFNSYFTYKCFR